jgi:N-acetyl-anhydromuramyl-L-alanine amidase AmpD
MWIPALYYQAGRSDYGVQYIVIHATDGSRTSGAVREFQTMKPNAEDRASSHYIIANGVGYPEHEAYEEGQVIQMVRDADTAYGIAIWPVGTLGAKHTGAIHNCNSISIELAGLPNDSGWCTEKMYEATAGLVRSLADKYGIPFTRDHILGHDEVGQTCSPPITTRFDPCGATGQCTFDWDHLMSLVTQASASESQPTVSSESSGGLLAWYSFDGNLKDRSGNGNDGTASGAVDFAPGRIGQALKLGGVSRPGYVRVPASSRLSVTSKMTLSFFLRVDGTVGESHVGGAAAAGEPQCIIAKSGDRAGWYCFLSSYPVPSDVTVRFGDRFYYGGEPFVPFAAGDTVGTGAFVDARYPITTGQWASIAIVYDAGRVTHYVDGVKVASATLLPDGLAAANAEDLYIGISNCAQIYPSHPLVYPLDGAIDELRIYNRALSPGEVAAVAHSAVETAGTPTPAPSVPDLVIANLTYGPTSSHKDDTVTFSVTVRNQGASDAGSFHVRLAGTAAYTGASVSALAAGASVTVSLSLQLSQNSETFAVAVDDLGQVAETSEANNTAQTTVVAGSGSSSQVARSVFCVEQGGFNYCGRLDYGYSAQWLQNRATNEIHLADAKKAGSLESIGAVDFDRIEIRLRVWSCYTDASARLIIDNIEVLLDSTGQAIASDDMEGNVLQRWGQWEWSGGGDLLAVISPDDQSQALQVYVPSGVNAYCAGVWAVRSFTLPFTVSTSNVSLKLLVGAEGLGTYHEGFFEIRLYKGR